MEDNDELLISLDQMLIDRLPRGTGFVLLLKMPDGTPLASVKMHPFAAITFMKNLIGMIGTGGGKSISEDDTEGT